MKRPHLSNLPPWEIILYVVVLLALVGGAFWLVFHYLRPAPPQKIILATGAPGGAYEYFGLKYQQALAKHGIEVVLEPSSGSVENLRLIKTDPRIDLAFIQGGIAVEPDSADLITLGSMYVEPLWIFYKGNHHLTRLSALAKLRVAIGAAGSGTQLFALQMLAATGIPTGSPNLLPMDAKTAATALLDGTINAALMVAAPEAPVVQTLLNHPDIRILDLIHAQAYAKRFPHLASYILPAGSLDLARPSPPQDLHLPATTATLVAKKGIHPAIISLLLQAAREIHGPAGLFQRDGEFPGVRDRGLPISSVAQRFYDSGPPLLQRYLPFWAAIIVERLIIAILPLLAILLPLMKVAPAIYNWKMRSRIYRWYGELRYLEDEIQADMRPERVPEWVQRLNRIEDRATHRRIPLSFSNELYSLRAHIELIRQRVQAIAPSSAPHPEQKKGARRLPFHNWRSGRDSNPRPPA